MARYATTADLNAVLDRTKADLEALGFRHVTWSADIGYGYFYSGLDVRLSANYEPLRTVFQGSRHARKWRKYGRG